MYLVLLLLVTFRSEHNISRFITSIYRAKLTKPLLLQRQRRQPHGYLSNRLQPENAVHCPISRNTRTPPQHMRLPLLTSISFFSCSLHLVLESSSWNASLPALSDALLACHSLALPSKLPGL